RQGAAVGADLLGRLFVDVGVAGLYQGLGELVHEAEVIAGEVQVLGAVGVPVEAQPPHRLDDGVDVFLVFFLGVRVVKAQVAHAAGFAGQPEVHANALGVCDVQIAVGLGREPRADAGRVGRAPGLDRGRARLAGPALALESVGLQIVVDDVAQEIGGGSRRGGGGHARERRKQRQSVNFATSALRNR